MSLPTVTHLERRRIEAGVIVPIMRALERAVGKEQASAVLREAILELAQADGARWAGEFGNDLAALEQVAGVWADGGALQIADAQRTEDGFSFKVTKCRYAELYQSLGLAELGFKVHCARDFAMASGFNPELSLTRTQTVMQGAPHCDFHFRRRK